MNKRVSFEKLSCFSRGSRKRGISAVVATVLIILITIAAMTIVWTAIIPMIEDSLDFSSLEGRVSVVTSAGYTFYDAAEKKASVQVKRDVDDGVMGQVNIIFSISGNSFGSLVLAPEPGNTRVYVFDLSTQGVPDSVSVAPVFKVGKKEKIGDVTSNVDLSSNGVVTSKANLNLIVGFESLINSSSWEIGEGSVYDYYRSGTDSENFREFGIGPYGDEVLLWKAVPDNSSNADGGWNTALISIDDSKTYRTTLWFKKTGSSAGSSYFGSHGPSTSRLDGSDINNPYFWSGDFPELDKWYLVVAYIHGSGDSSMTNYGGIYDGETGEKISSITDFKNKVGITQQRQRAYLYYDTTITDRQYFWNPTFSDVTGYDLPIEVQN